ncbi:MULTISPECIES: hypothetical protein [Paenibacillus]|uniref:hypothetical protein n=1 Tax=Paenibacillus TaxID=44249 RepID=UPI0033408FDE
MEQEYEVLNIDTRRPEEALCPTLTSDLENLGETYSVLNGADAVVHLAAIPAMHIRTTDVTSATTSCRLITCWRLLLYDLSSHNQSRPRSKLIA